MPQCAAYESRTSGHSCFLEHYTWEMAKMGFAERWKWIEFSQNRSNLRCSGNMCAYNEKKQIFTVSNFRCVIMTVPEEDMEEVTGHIRDFFITAAVLLSSFGISVLIQNFFATETMAALIFVMAVFITALTTDGYKWGVVARLSSAFLL